ncbi:hypothetical protein GCM10020254_71640 [Streptomyces goshikiensis]
MEAGVTHESVSSVPPTTPMERLSFCGVGPVAGARACGALIVSDIGTRFRSADAVNERGSGIASEAVVSKGVSGSRADMESPRDPQVNSCSCADSIALPAARPLFFGIKAV